MPGFYIIDSITHGESMQGQCVFAVSGSDEVLVTSSDHDKTYPIGLNTHKQQFCRKLEANASVARTALPSNGEPPFDPVGYDTTNGKA